MLIRIAGILGIISYLLSAISIGIAVPELIAVLVGGAWIIFAAIQMARKMLRFKSHSDCDLINTLKDLPT